MKFRIRKSRRLWLSERGDYRIERRFSLLGTVYRCRYLGKDIGRSLSLRGPAGALQLCRTHAQLHGHDKPKPWQPYRNSTYAGLMTNQNLNRRKYSGCEYVRKGYSVRKLTEDEIAEFRSHVQRVIDPGLREAPVLRKAVV